MASIQIQNKESESQSHSEETAKIEIVVDHENNDPSSTIIQIIPTEKTSNRISMIIKALFLPVLAKVHAGYFRISLGLCSQALLWKILISEPSNDIHPFRRILQMLPFTAFILLWSLALFILVSLSLLYLLHCFLHYDVVRTEFFHHVGVNYLFAPWISWLLLLQSTPFFKPGTTYYMVLWWVFILPILALDFKIYGEWFTKGKRVLSGRMANPTTQLSAIGNLVGAGAAAQMGWIETAICMFSLGMVHYFVLFVTLYQRLPGSSNLPAMLRPVFFSFIATPSIASLAWTSIAGNFDISSKMLFFLSLFMFISLISRPALFKKAMKKFSVAWWAYSFPLTFIAIASTKYAQEVKSGSAHLLMLFLSALSVLVSLALMVVTALNGTDSVLPYEDDDKNNNKQNKVTAEACT